MFYFKYEKTNERTKKIITSAVAVMRTAGFTKQKKQFFYCYGSEKFIDLVGDVGDFLLWKDVSQKYPQTVFLNCEATTAKELLEETELALERQKDILGWIYKDELFEHEHYEKKNIQDLLNLQAERVFIADAQLHIKDALIEFL